MSKLSVDDLKRIHSDDETPQHVKDFNDANGAEKYGGPHFDDPAHFDQDGKPKRKQGGPDFKTGSQAPNPATDKMVKFLRDLVAERAPDTDPEFTQHVIDQGFDRVRKAINNLKAMPKVENTVKPQTQTSRFNQYAGQCEDCSGHVAPQEGRLSKTDDGRWEVIHIECPPSEFPFPYGRYAVDTDEGHLAFYILTEKGLFVQASDEKHRVPNNAIAAITAKIAADPEGASLRYGRELEQCGRCGKALTDQDSRDRGIGPVCAEKGWS